MHQQQPTQQQQQPQQRLPIPAQNNMTSSQDSNEGYPSMGSSLRSEELQLGAEARDVAPLPEDVFLNGGGGADGAASNDRSNAAPHCGLEQTRIET